MALARGLGFISHKMLRYFEINVFAMIMTIDKYDVKDVKLCYGHGHGGIRMCFYSSAIGHGQTDM